MMAATIAVLRKQRNLTQAELAKRVGVSVRTICHWETGTRTPHIGNCRRLAEALDVRIDELVFPGELVEGSQADSA